MGSLFDLKGRVAIITGGAGLLGKMHAEAIASQGGIPVLIDINSNVVGPDGFVCDITKADDVKEMMGKVVNKYGQIDILINNAANNPKIESMNGISFSRVENFPLEQWNADIAVGLTGSFLCAKIVGTEMAKKKSGVILNIASDLSVIAPDQRIYRKEGLSNEEQIVKPVTYSVVKTALIGLTRYLATYWAESGVRVNAISMGGVSNNQPDGFVKKLTQLIPMARMAKINEYQGAIVFLCSDASSYMTGHNLVMDGGRSVW